MTPEERKEFFEDYKETVKKYSIVCMDVSILKDEDGQYFFDEANLIGCIYIVAGTAPEELIIEAFKDWDFEGIDREGCWHIEALMKYTRGSIEEGGYMEILLVETTFSQTIEERNKQAEEWAEFEKGNKDIFGNTINSKNPNQ